MVLSQFWFIRHRPLAVVDIVKDIVIVGVCSTLNFYPHSVYRFYLLLLVFLSSLLIYELMI